MYIYTIISINKYMYMYVYNIQSGHFLSSTNFLDLIIMLLFPYFHFLLHNDIVTAIVVTSYY